MSGYIRLRVPGAKVFLRVWVSTLINFELVPWLFATGPFGIHVVSHGQFGSDLFPGTLCKQFQNCHSEWT